MPKDKTGRQDSQAQAAGNDDIFNEKYIRRTHKLPAHSEYPELTIPIANSPKTVVLEVAGGISKLRSEFTDADARGIFRCNAFVTIRGGREVSGIGEGVRKVRNSSHTVIDVD